MTLPSLGISLKELERLAIVQALSRCGWIQKDAAAFLHISPRVLHYKIRQVHQIQPDVEAVRVRPWKPLLPKRRRGAGGAKLTQVDVDVIRDDARRIPGSFEKRAKRIANRAKGLFGPWQRIYAILTGDTWNRR